MQTNRRTAGQTDRRTDGQTDGQTDRVKPRYPQTLFAGGINIMIFIVTKSLPGMCWDYEPGQLYLPKCKYLTFRFTQNFHFISSLLHIAKVSWFPKCLNLSIFAFCPTIIHMTLGDSKIRHVSLHTNVLNWQSWINICFYESIDSSV